MYKVLLVDDEPIILSGIKFLIDWQANDCTIVGTARNGQQALEKIEEHQPDFIICDINMPVMSGIELLRQVSESHPGTVFIMLTNLEEFALAREALRLRAADYLLKNQLETETLEKSLAAAKEEHSKRQRLACPASAEAAPQGKLLAEEVFLHLVQNVPGSPVRPLAQMFHAGGLTPGYAVLYLPVTFTTESSRSPEDPDEAPLSETTPQQEHAHLFAWQQEVVSKLAQNFFAHHCLFTLDKQYETLVLGCWGETPEGWPQKLGNFYTRLCSASGNITQATVGVLSTDLFFEPGQLEACRNQFFALRDYHYLTGALQLTYDRMPSLTYGSLGLAGISERFTGELNVKNLTGCTALFQRALARLQDIPHHRSQALWLCGEIYGAVADTFPRIMPELPPEHWFHSRAEGYRQIERLLTLSQVLVWLKGLHNETAALLGEMNNGRSEFAERAREYVQRNVYSRIMLQDVADHVCISPGYLSAMFKRMYGQNLVEYINQCKMEIACRLLDEGKLRIGEVSYQLSFENPYYFTKVFKKHTGMTPSEYQKRQKQP